MKLLYATFKGLPSTKELDLAFTDVNVFVGPNGSGKSTVLNLLKLALDLLSRHTVSGLIGEVEDWLVFETAELVFAADADSISHFVPAILDENGDLLSVTLRCQDGRFYIETLASEIVTIDSKAVTAFIRPTSIEEVNAARDALLTTENAIKELGRRITGEPSNAASLRSQLAKHQQALNGQVAHLDKMKQCEISKAGRVTEEINREVIDQALASANFPSVVLVESEKAIGAVIPTLIDSMCGLQSGKRLQKKEFQAAHARLEHLLQHEADFSEKSGQRFLTIDGTDYRKSSSGTQASLAYFGLTNFLRPNDIVIWDEPENGLHPTRRIRVLDLILRDHRQFFIATHALEFAPVFAPKGKIFRCDSEYNEGADNPTLAVSEVRGRKQEFLLLEALGVQPARTLFTANVVIWVEGPTELVFYRHWLTQALQPKGLEEGFHYTIMHYGGGLISYLGVADELQLSHAFDALSICRRLVILVDSDLRNAVNGGVDQHLKPGTRRVKEQIARLNEERPGSGLFSITAGREIENYLPPHVLLHAASQCWEGYSNHHEKLVAKDMAFGRYDSFETALETFLLNAGVSKKVTRNGIEQVVAPGKTQWGGVNKVEMMRAALSYADLEPADLQWGFSDDLAQMVEFIQRANAS